VFYLSRHMRTCVRVSGLVIGRGGGEGWACVQSEDRDVLARSAVHPSRESVSVVFYLSSLKSRQGRPGAVPHPSRVQACCPRSSLQCRPLPSFRPLPLLPSLLSPCLTPAARPGRRPGGQVSRPASAGVWTTCGARSRRSGTAWAGPGWGPCPCERPGLGRPRCSRRWRSRGWSRENNVCVGGWVGE
jgi:hypothetical protein